MIAQNVTISYRAEESPLVLYETFHFENLMRKTTSFLRRMHFLNTNFARDECDAFVDRWIDELVEACGWPLYDDDFEDVIDLSVNLPPDRHWSDDDEEIEQRVEDTLAIKCYKCNVLNLFYKPKENTSTVCSACSERFVFCTYCSYYGCIKSFCKCGFSICSNSFCSCESEEHFIKHTCPVETYTFRDTGKVAYQHCIIKKVDGVYRCDDF